MPKQSKKKLKKSHYIKNDYFSKRDSGSLGGAVSSELGFMDLEAAKDYLEQFNPWNAEEKEMQKEQKQRDIKSQKTT